METFIPQMVWMEVDVKNKELPLKVADTAAELAQMCGTTESTVISTASRVRRGIYRRGRFVKVWIGD